MEGLTIKRSDSEGAHLPKQQVRALRGKKTQQTGNDELAGELPDAPAASGIHTDQQLLTTCAQGHFRRYCEPPRIQRLASY
jgi:hypothetical protein